MNNKHNEVQQWLDAIFTDEAVPGYEVNPPTVETLWRLKELNQRQDQAIGLVLNDMAEKTTQYSLLGQELMNTLSGVGLSPTSLSQSGTVSLRTLVNVALLLKSKDASTTNLMLSISTSSQAAMKLADARKLEQKLYSQLVSKTKSAYVKLTALNKALSSLEEETKCQGPELEKKAKQAGFLQSKAREYSKNMQHLQKDLKACGVDPAVYHGTLQRKAEELQELRDKLHPMRARLDSYQKLPPDLALARVKVEEARRELEALEDQVSNQIDLMHM